MTDLTKAATVAAPTRLALRDIADDAGARMTELAARNTPRVTGRTAESWEQIPARRVRHETGLPAYESGARNGHYKARWLEHGVAPHDIRPRNAQALDTPEGPRAGARVSGFAGFHMVARAAEEVDATLGEIAQPALSRWAASIEDNAKRHDGIG